MNQTIQSESANLLSPGLYRHGLFELSTGKQQILCWNYIDIYSVYMVSCTGRCSGFSRQDPITRSYFFITTELQAIHIYSKENLCLTQIKLHCHNALMGMYNASNSFPVWDYNSRLALMLGIISFLDIREKSSAGNLSKIPIVPPQREKKCELDSDNCLLNVGLVPLLFSNTTIKGLL